MSLHSKTEFTACLQAALNECLTLFLNAGIPGEQYYIAPADLAHVIEKAVRTKRWPATLERVTESLRVICDKNINSRSESITQSCGLLVECYGILEELISEKKNNTQSRIINIDKTVIPSIYRDDLAYLSPVFELASYAKRYLQSWTRAVLLHGSLATLDYANDFSDLDTIVIIAKQTFSSSLQLELFRRAYRRSLGYLYWFDPLQHHGHIILTEYDLSWYPERILPIAVFENARSLTGKELKIDFLVRDSTNECLNEFGRVFRAFKDRATQSWFPKDAWTTKSFLSELMLLPSIYSQALGYQCYKKYSFEIARETIPQDIWKVVDEATEIRQKWHYHRVNDLLSRSATHFGLHPWIVKKLSTNRKSRVLSQLPRKIDRTFVQAAANLADSMREQVEK
jgi:hypothetical protein